MLMIGIYIALVVSFLQDRSSGSFKRSIIQGTTGSTATVGDDDDYDGNDDYDNKDDLSTNVNENMKHSIV